MAEAFGITAESSADETDRAIRRAFNQAGPGGTVLLNDFGADWVVNDTLFLPSDFTLRLGTNAVVQAADNPTFRDNAVPLIRGTVGRENITIESDGTGTIRGIADVIRGISGEDSQTGNVFNFRGHGVQFFSTRNVTVRNINLDNHGGDGLQFIGADPQFADQNWVENRLVEGVVSTNNRRQGFSLDSGRNIVVRDSVFEATRGENPSSGIDLEPTFSYERLENILIENNVIRGNRNDGLQFALSNLDASSAPVSVTARGNWIEANGAAGIFVGQFRLGQDDAQISGEVRIEDTTIVGSGLFDQAGNADENVAAVRIVQNPGPSARSRDEDLRLIFDGLSIADTADNRPGTRFGPIGITSFAGAEAPDTVGNVTFTDLGVLDGFDRPFFETRLVADRAALENVRVDGVVGSPGGTGVVLEGRAQTDVDIDVTDLATLTEDLVAADPGASGASLVLDLAGNVQYALLAEASVATLGDLGELNVVFRDAAGAEVLTRGLDFRNVDEDLELLRVFTSPVGFASAELVVEGPAGFAPADVRLFAVRAVPEPGVGVLLGLGAVGVGRRTRSGRGR